MLVELRHWCAVVDSLRREEAAAALTRAQTEVRETRSHLEQADATDRTRSLSCCKVPLWLCWRQWPTVRAVAKLRQLSCTEAVQCSLGTRAGRCVSRIYAVPVGSA